MADTPFDSADYELVWPTELFARELRALQAHRNGQERRARIETLLSEAFLGEQPRRDYESRRSFGSGDDEDDTPWSDSIDLPTLLLARLGDLREHHRPRPYWPHRHGDGRRTKERARAPETAFVTLINELRADGYLDLAFPRDCVDATGSIEIDPSEVLEDRLSIPDLWPLRPRDWDEDTFFGLVEVFHDLVARPRARSYHSWNQCGWHYSEFSTDIGRALYRWRVNRLLESNGVDLRLAADGEDVGRMVRIVDDGRSDLIERALANPDSGIVDRLAHAIAQFRARAADEHDKRSAVLTLVGVLEERRDLIKSDVGRKDEAALFTIANEFAIRHQRRGQQGDYDPAFLDWVFWWYLATIELTDQILARQASGTATSTP